MAQGAREQLGGRAAQEPLERLVLLASKETLDKKATQDSREKREIKEKRAKPGLIRPPQWQERLRRQGLRPLRLWRRRSQLLSRRPQNRAPLALLAILALRALPDNKAVVENRVRRVSHPPSQDPLGKPDKPLRAPPVHLEPLGKLDKPLRVPPVHLDPPIPNY